jgi:hypothetical protein
VTIFDPCYPWQFPFPWVNALAVPQLAEKIHRNIDAIVAASGTDGARSTTMAAIQKAKDAGDLTETDVQRLTAIVNTDSADAHKLYLEALDDPTASEFAAMLLAVIQLPRARGTGPAQTPATTDTPHVHVFTDADLVALGLLGGPIVAIGIGIALASEHIHIS